MIRAQDPLPEAGLYFLKHCYRFVNEKWQRAAREDVPDQGFERSFRESCINDLVGWEVSPQREMHLGYALETASGTLHEIDVVAKHKDVNSIMELKNRQDYPNKNDVIVFFAKMLDYLAASPMLLLREVCPVFISSTPFEESGLAACLGLGIHPVGPRLRPVPILIDTARRIEVELGKGVQLTTQYRDTFGDFCAQLNHFCLALSETWVSGRCGYRSEDTIVLKAVAAPDTVSLSQELKQLNSDCALLLAEVRKAMP